MKGQHGGGADTGTVQQPQGQALHEGEGRCLRCAVVDGAGDGGQCKHGVEAHDMAVLQLQHTWQEGLGGLRVRNGGVSVEQRSFLPNPAPLHWGEQPALDA